MELDPASAKRLTIGYWLYHHRGWGLVPLLALGLLPNTEWLTVKNGTFMLAAGAVGVLFGTLLRITSYTFSGERPLPPKGLPDTLVTEGPYMITRNPVYLAEAAIALGIAMMSRMPWLVLATLLVGALASALIIEWEENFLRSRFGEAYEEYCRIVPRWFSFSRLIHPECYAKTRGRVHLLRAVRAESITLLIGLLAILAFLAKADLETYL